MACLRVIVGYLFVACCFGIEVAAQETAPVLKEPATYAMPDSVIEAEIDGKVVVAIRVDESGAPSKAMMIIGPVWPCGTMPKKAIDELASTLADMAMKLKFTPAMKDGKPVERAIGLTLDLKNPRLGPKPIEIDPITGKPKAKLVTGGVLNGKAIHLPKPRYPAAARENRDAGSVSIYIHIDEEGKVIRAGAVNGATTLQWAAREAACGAKFSPTRLDGNPVKVAGVITYNFVP